MHPFFSRFSARIIVSTLVATLACAVVAPNATPVSAAGAGIIDYAATFNGSSYFQVADNDAFDMPGNFSVEAWLKPSSTCINGGVMCQFVNKENSYEFGVVDGLLKFAITNSTGVWDWYPTDTTMLAGVWQHVALTVNRSANTITAYYNGEKTSEITNSTQVPTTGRNSPDAFTIGARAAGIEKFYGEIDEFRLYAEVRSAANIKTDMYTYGTANNSANLKAYYDFNGASNTLVNDAPSAASGTNLTATGTITWNDIKTVSNPTTLYNRTVITFPRSYITSNGGWTVPSGVTRVDVLVVAGGGGGGGGSDTTGWSGGGGGAGGLRTLTNSTVTPGAALALAVGGGGHRGNNGSNISEYLGSNGAASIFGSTSTIGGGYGGMNNYSGANGGSGGGAGTWASNGSLPGTGTAGEGNAGGASSGNCCAGGGGGGAGGVGGAASGTTGGAAGNGLSNSITGTATFYAGGGAGYGTGTRGAAGSSGGVAAVTNATTGTGSGGGGGGGNGSYFTAGYGGSGAVIVSYASPVSIDSTNRSMQFAGTSASKVTVPDNNLIDLNMDLTAEAWIYPTDTSCSGNKTFMGKENSYLFAVCNNFISFALRGISGNTWAWYQTTVPVSANTWAHFAFVRSAGRLSIYKNGGTAAGGTEYTTTTGVPTDAFYNSSDVFTVGGRPSCSTECFTGYVDDVRIWSYSRSASAIAQNYNKRVASDLLYFSFDESVGTKVANFATTTGSALNGTSTGTTNSTAYPTTVNNTYTASNVSGFLPGYDYQTDSAVTYSISSNGAKGTATVSASTGAFSYTANPGATGNDTFTYAVTGANGTATYSYTVSAPSQPMASSKTFQQASDVAATLNTPTSLGYTNPSTTFTLGETVRATLSVTNGTVNLTQGSTSLISGSLGTSTFTIDGTQSQINTALNTATVTATSAIPTRVTLDIGMKPVDQTISSRTYTYNSNGHYYTRITSGFSSYNTAISAAQAMTLGSRPGYLATIQNSGENTTISGINGTNSWIGATDSAKQGTYIWKGNDTNSIFRVSPNPYRSRYGNWNSGEPNGETGGEDYIEQTSTGAWNDCADSCNRTSAIVEFDPMSSRTVTNLDFTKSLAATALSARNLGLGTTFLNNSTWANGEIVTATVTANAGTVSYSAGTTSITSGASGSSTMTFEGNVASMNTALNTVAVTPSTTGTSTVAFTYGVKRATTGSYVYNAVSDHFYFSNATTANLAGAQTNAASAKWAGTSGYLVTITSDSEYNTVRNINRVASWSGGSDAVSEGQWAWDAPDAYQIFSDFDNGVGGAVSYFDPSGEPNNSGNGMPVNFGSTNTFFDDADTSGAYAQIYEFAPIDSTLTFNVTTGPAISITTPTSGLAATTGTAYSLTLATSGGAGSNVFALASGTLPTGLGLNTSSGVISGTTSGGASSNAITVSVTDANSATATTSSFTITSTPLACSTSTTIVGNYTVEKVTATGSCTWTVPTGVTSLDAFVVGGGGGGGADGGGGGGGGAYQPISGYSVTAGDAITMTVGNGGTPGVWGGGASTAGANSSLSKNGSFFAIANGGSGGTSGPNQALGAGGTSTTGFAGGAGGASSTTAGVYGGVGKAGASNYFYDTVAYYGGGGAGGPYDNGSMTTVIAGGLGGGGCAGSRANNTHTVGCNGTANTGGGGGAGVAGSPQTSGGTGGSGIAVIRYATDPLNAFPASIGTPAYRMVAEDFQTLDSTRKQWIDSSGNGRHSVFVTGSPTINTTTGNGTGGTIRMVSGSTSDAVRFSIFSPTTTNKYTLFQVARLTGPTRARILDGVNTNWLSGFWGGSLGVAWHGSWTTPSGSNSGTNMNNWQLMTDQNTMFRQNGINRTGAPTGQNFDAQLGLNAGLYGTNSSGALIAANERSDFNAAEFILYNGELTAAQIRQVENYLARAYNLQGYDFDNVWKGANGPGAPTAAKSGTASTGSATQLDLTWTATQDTTGVSGYKVEYKKTSDSTWTTFSASTSGTSVTVTGLTAGTAYDTRVTPVDSAAPNRPSVSAAATTWATSSIALGAMPSSPVTGTNYTLTATVTGPSTTTGTVAFMDGGTVINACGTTSVLSGTASCTWQPTTAGSHDITASFTGDTAYLSSSTVSATAVSVDYGACATTSTTTGRYTYLKVTTTGMCKISTLPSGVESVDVLVVGGGGGGGENVGSGGSGGGGYYAERVVATSSSALTVTVGAGGRAGSYPTDTSSATTLRDGGNGEASSISWSTNTFTGNGGIGGQTHWADNKCGGVGWTNTTTPGGTGSGSGGTALTGGTGGLDGSGTGANASAGGSGFSNSITGTATFYGGGGGGGAWGGGLGAAGGNGGGGAGVNTGNGVSGTANTGGGGGGGTAGCTAGGAGGSGIAIVRYANVPTISTQPVAATRSAGFAYTFSATPAATGAVNADFTYQWRKDGVNISGATASSLAFTNLAVADAGTYSVVIKSYGTSGAVSTVTSSGAVLTMNKGTQSITFGTLADRIYGVSPFALTATSSAGLTVTLTSTTTGVCTVSGTTLTVISNGTCSVTASQAGDANYEAANNVIQSFVVATKSLTITGMTASNKEYDRGVSATISLTSATLVGVVPGDTVNIDSSSATGAFADKLVASGKIVTASSVALSGTHASRYNLTQPTTTANITAKALTVSGITANNRDYNGSASATSLLLTGSAALVGVISTDAVTLSTSGATGVFATKSVGASKTITISGLTISGGDSANYTLTQPTTTASIGVKTITVTGITANNRIYDSTTGATSLLVTNTATLAGVESGDTVTLSTTNAAGVFADKNVGTAKTITISGLTIGGANAGEYTLTQPTTTANITAKELTVTGITATNRVYDSTTAATSLLVKGSAALAGKQGADDVVLSTANAAATFANKNIGTNKPVTITGLTITGTDVANYTLTQPSTTASITAKDLTVTGITATDRIYDSTTNATALLVRGSATLIGKQGLDDVVLSTTSAAATFADKVIGTNKTVSITGISISGADIGNYTLTQPSTTASITAKELTVSNVTATSRMYNASNVAALNTGAASLLGKQGSDVVTINVSSAAGTFSSKTVATGKTVTITGIAIGGADAGNYTLTQPSTTANITAKGLTVTGITATDRTYNAGTSATSLLVKTSAALASVESGDIVTLDHSAATATFADKTIGTNKTITIAGITIGGTDAGNYTLTQPSTTASITAKELTVTGITATDRTYNADTSATALLVKGLATLVGKQGLDDVTLSTTSATATFATKTVGTNKPITIAGITIGGTDAGNYTLTQPSTTASITAKELTVTGITATNRVYDSTNSATALLVKTSAALAGKQGSDDVTLSTTSATATFATKTVGTNKPITIAGITIGGADAGNYTLTQPSTTASITAKELTVTGITAADRTYSPTRSATLSTGSATFVGVFSGDIVTINTSAASGLFDTASYGTNKTVTVSGITSDGADAANYTITQPTVTASIARKAITVTGITATDRVYNASASATALLVKTSAALSGVEIGDTVTLDHSAATATFADKNIGTNKPITIAGITIGGADASNYALTQPSTMASISAKELTVTGITATDRTYDSTTNATSLLVKGSATLVGKQGSDNVLMSTTNAVGTFNNKTVGTVKTVNITGITISGTDVGNYTLTQPSTTANITAKNLTVSGITANNRVYDSSVSATALLVKTSAALQGVEIDDTVTFDHSGATATFANKNIGANKPITIVGITIAGADAGNYTLTQPATSASITAKELTVSNVTAASRIYNNSNVATLNTGAASLVGKQGSDIVTINTSAATGTFSSKTVATGKTVTIAGITIAGTDAGNYTLTQPSTTANITAKGLTITGITATNRVYDSSVSATALLVKTSAALQGVETNDTVTLDHSGATATFANKNIGTNKPVTIADITIAGTDAANYTLTQPSTTANITAKTLTVSGITAANRVYDSSTSATALLAKTSAALQGVETNDTVTLDHSGATATFANKNIGTNKPVTIVGITIAGADAGNYSLTQPATTASITAKELTVSNVTATSRIYDSTDVATLNTSTASLVGKQGSDIVTINTSAATGTFSSKTVATGKTVTIAGITIGGADAGNYTLTQPSTTANITTKTLTVSGITASDRTYTTTRTATLFVGSAALVGVVSGDAVTINTNVATGLFDSSAYGTNKTVSITGITIEGADSANYTVNQPSVTASIVRKILTITGITANNRVYDSSISASSLLVTSSAVLEGVEIGDTVTLDHSAATATFADKNIGTNKPITIAGITISGTDAANYSLTQPTTTANITAKTLTVSGISANNRVYDSTNSATSLLVTTSAALVGKQGSDDVSLSTSNATATFVNKNIGTNKPITTAGITISGTDASNYTLTQPTTTANITAKTLTVSGITATNRIYDSSTSASALLVKTSAALQGVEVGDTVTLDHSSATATFANKNIGTNKPITISGITISGTDASNYTLTQPTTTANIAAKGLTVSGITATNRMYDSSTLATVLLVKSSAALVGKQGSDDVSLSTSNATATFADKNIGNNKPITIAGITISGTDASNYTLTQPTTTANITAKGLTVSGITATNRMYDSSTLATVLLVKSSAALVGKQGSDDVSLSTSNATATFADKNIGNNKPITIADITISGNDAANYTLTQPSTTANITAKTLTVSGITATDRVYDSTNSATALLVKTSAALEGVETNDTVTLDHSAATATFANKNIGNNKPITIADITIGGTDAGNYALTQPTTTATISRKAITVTGITAATKIYDGTTSADITTTGAQLVGKILGDDMSLVTSSATGSFADSAVANAKTVQIAGLTLTGSDISNYLLTQPTTTADLISASAGLAWNTPSSIVYGTNLSASQLNATANVAGTFVYTPASGTRLPVGTHTLSVAFTPTNTAYDPDTMTVSITVTAKILSVTGITASNRVYNSTRDATSLLETSSATLVGVVSGDSVLLNRNSVTAQFADKNIGTNKTVSVMGLTISGDTSNYTLTQPTTTASITTKELTVSNVTAASKTYNRSTVAAVNTGAALLQGVEGNDSVTLDVSSAIGTFSDFLVGSGKTVAISGLVVNGDISNYTLTQPNTTANITVKQVTVSGISATDRVYNATNIATAQLVKTSPALVGVETGDTVTIDHSGATATFANKNVGDNKVISVSGITIGGANANNYTLSQPTTSASITSQVLTVSGITANNRTYNASIDATDLLVTTSAVLVGKQGLDEITLSTANATATFDSKNVGITKTVFIDHLSISGSDSSNYTLTQPTTSASISRKALTVTGITANNKIYNTNTTASINTSSSSLQGLELGDVVSIDNSASSALFASSNVANNIVVTVSGVAATGIDAGNYSIKQPTTNANITQASASLSWNDPSDLVFGTSLSAIQLNATAGVSGAFTYTPSAGTRLDVGTHLLQVSFTPASSNFAVATQSVSITVTRKSLAVATVAKSITYGSALSMTYSISGLEGSDTDSAVTFTYAGTGNTTYASSTTQPTGAGTYSVTPSDITLTAGLTTNYGITYTPAVLIITKASQVQLTAVASTYSLTYAPAPQEPTISLSVLGGSGNGAVTYAVTSNGGICSVAGTVLTGLLAGTCTVVATRAESNNYVSRDSAPITITVEKAPQELTFNAIANKTYGDANFVAVATTTSGLPVALSAGPSGICEIVSGLTIHIVSNGDCTVSATQVGNANYLSATTASGSFDSRSFNIARKTLTISGTTISGRTYDQSLNATNLVSYTSSILNGVVVGDTVSINPTNATATFASKSAGQNKPVSVSGVVLTGPEASRYVLTQPTGLTATISQSPISVAGISVPTRAYNSLTSAVLNSTNYTFSGVVSGDAVTLDDTAYTAELSTAITGNAKVVTVSGLALSGTDANNYSLTQPILQGNIVKATASITFASLRSTTYNASPQALATNTAPNSLTVIPSYIGSGTTTYGPVAVAPTNAGSYSLTANISDVNYEGTATSAWRINKQTISIQIDQSTLQKTFVGSAHVVPVSTSPSGKNVTVTYQGINGTVYNSSYAPTNAGSYLVTASVIESNFDGSASPVLTVAPATQSDLVFVSGTSAAFGSTHQLVAVGGSGSGLLTYVRVSGSCSVNPVTGVMTPTSVGSCVVRADRASSTNYLNASSSNHAVQIMKGTQLVSFTSRIPSSSTVGTTYTPTAASSSELAPTISITAGANNVCSLSGGIVTFLSTGICEITATQSGDSNWLAATPAVQIIEIGKLSQAISFAQPIPYELGHPGFIPEASSSSGLAVSIAVPTGNSACSQSSTGLITFISVGTCSLTASQNGDSIFSAASSVSRLVTVLPSLPSTPHISSISSGDGTVTVGYNAATNNGGTPITSYVLTATSATAPTITQSNCDPSTLYCTLVGLVNGASYNVSVSAVNARGAGLSSESAEVLIPSPSTIAVQSVTGTRTSNNLEVSWEDPNTYGEGSFVQYEVSLRERGGTFGSPVTVQSLRISAQAFGQSTQPNVVLSPSNGIVRTLTTRSRTARFSNLDPSRLYEAKIVTVTSASATESANNTTSALVMPLALPSAPRALHIEATSSSSAQVSWSSPFTDGGSTIQSYSATSSIGSCVPATALARTCSITGLTSGSSLTVSVNAANAIGTSVSATVSYTMPTTPGAPIINLVATTASAATITWTAPVTNGGRAITSYSVIANNGGTQFRCTTTGLSCVINGLAIDTTYSFTVRAINNIGPGTTSSAVNGATPPPPATPPTRTSSSDWTTYRNSTAASISSALLLPPAPARVTVQSLAGGKRTRVTATRNVRDSEATITYAIISVSSRTKKLLARIKVQVDPSNPTTSVSVPYASDRVKVTVQFANQIGISAGGPAGVNISEGNTFEWTTANGKATIVGDQVPGDITFARGSSVVSSAMKKSLRTIASTAKSRGGLVYVSGFSTKGELASAWLLEPLARARAEAVAKYLATVGVRQWITFHGSSSPIATSWGTSTGRQVIISTVAAIAV